MDRVKTPSVTSPSGESKPRTPAYAKFDSNTDKLLRMLQFINTGASGFRGELETKLMPEANKIIKDIAELNAPQDKEKSDQVALDSAERGNLLKKLLNALVSVQQFTEGLLTVREWIPVLLVTTVEAYLQDVLIYTAKVDPAIMKPRPTVPYEDVVKAQSLEQLKADLNEILPARWARNVLNDGGPKSWIKKFTKMGARGYRPETASEMETLWGVRHLIVHSVGVATAEFVRRHPEIGAKVDERVLIRSVQLSAWITVIYHFVDVTDSYFVQRYSPVLAN